MRRSLMLLAVSAVVLAGCQTTQTGKTWTPPQFKPDKPCKPEEECSTWVNPLEDWVPRKIVMDAGPGTRKVEWKSLWAFQNGGILFDEKGRAALVEPCKQSGPWKVVCEFKAVTGEFKYTIDVVGYDPVDPWYVNR